MRCIGTVQSMYTQFWIATVACSLTTRCTEPLCDTPIASQHGTQPTAAPAMQPPGKAVGTQQGAVAHIMRINSALKCAENTPTARWHSTLTTAAPALQPPAGSKPRVRMHHVRSNTLTTVALALQPPAGCLAGSGQQVAGAHASCAQQDANHSGTCAAAASGLPGRQRAASSGRASCAQQDGALNCAATYVLLTSTSR
jgi:hypothetical protein